MMYLPEERMDYFFGNVKDFTISEPCNSESAIKYRGETHFPVCHRCRAKICQQTPDFLLALIRAILYR
jgi:hypothetical protein